MNSKALPFLIIAGLVLIGAVVWNLTSSDEGNTGVPTTKPDMVVEEKNIVKPEPKKVTVNDVVIEDYDQAELVPAQTKEEYKAHREKAATQMRFAMRFQTIESAIEGLKALKANGDEKTADDLLDYIRTAYPNATIPSELLD